MGVVLTAFLAYIGVYAGVLLGSFSAEELPVGRYRLRILQLIVLAVLLSVIFFVGISTPSILFILIALGLLTTEVLHMLTHKVSGLSMHPRTKMLITYGLFGLLVPLSAASFGFTFSALIFLFGLITGSLIAEPYVEDRSIVPWDKPYKVAARWTWTYPLVLLIGFLIF